MAGVRWGYNQAGANLVSGQEGMFAWGHPLQIKLGKASKKEKWGKASSAQAGRRHSWVQAGSWAAPQTCFPHPPRCLHYALPLLSLKEGGKLEFTPCLIKPSYAMLCSACSAGTPYSFSSAWLVWGNISSPLPPHTPSTHFFGDTIVWFLYKGEWEIAGVPRV